MAKKKTKKAAQKLPPMPMHTAMPDVKGLPKGMGKGPMMRKGPTKGKGR